MSYLIEGCPSLIYLFFYSIDAKSRKEGLKKVMPMVKRCEEFADSLHIYGGACEAGFFDDTFHIRLTFNIKEPEDGILVKVSALFAFAASAKLTLGNQFFYPK